MDGADMAAGDEAEREGASVPSISRGEETKVILASSLGTVFEWYDFFLYGLLAGFISAQFFSNVNETTAFILALAAFGAGFIVRPFGALLFGAIGDRIGRKTTFLATMILMGLATFAVGLLPNYATIGVAAPLILVTLRLLQGLAVGGEYGGAATYVAEHAPEGRRGFFTSWIQATATIGLFAALIVVISLRTAMGEEAFADWGWRVPFLISILLLAISVWIRLQLSESPVFQRMKEEGETTRTPLRESFARWPNLKLVLIVLFGAVAGQAVVWYTGQFYALFFLERMLKVDGATANILIAIALVIGTPFFILFGWLSDKVGRKKIVLTGLLLAAISYFPAFYLLTAAANPALAEAQSRAPITVEAYAPECSFQFDPIGKNTFDTTSCDIAKATLARTGLSYTVEPAAPNALSRIRVGNAVIVAPDPEINEPRVMAVEIEAFRSLVAAEIEAAGYPATADPDEINRPAVVAILVWLVLVVTMTYGPIAALLVEMFPARIRYSSMSLPYHIGNGWFGGFLPTTAFAIVAWTGNIYAGLWYPALVIAMTLVVGIALLPETYRKRIDH